ncbi:uncharacterized protein LOC133669048 [Populus nigra]|uniref:uncharacterized protein LOC133669048 n=1 Tax=Populus nigra TaxID=3691 RepID=UPI002B26A329|nr:uncharacterized protein LOC133669048 [Populus nigra]
MENEERAHLEAHYQRELESMKNDITRLTSLLEQALASKSIENTSTQPAVATPSVSMPAAPFVFTSQNLGANPSLFEQQSTTNVPPAQVPVTVNLTADDPRMMKFSKHVDYEKLTALEDRLRAVEGADLYDPVHAAEMCLVPNVVVPKEFRVPEFIKYTGTECPVTHLKSYCNKMAEVVNDEKLLIHFFQDSLSGSALSWYTRLDNTKIRKWKDLVKAFVEQYKFNMEVAPDRSSLLVMEKGNKETVREYALRWREKASHVQPSLLEKEMVTLFSNTFKSPYFEHLVGSSAQHFYDAVTIAERIEQAIRMGRMLEPTEKKGFTGKKKDSEVNNVEGVYKGKKKNYHHYNFQIPTQQVASVNFTKPFPTNQQNPPNDQQSNQIVNPPRRNFQRTQERLPPLPLPLGEMYSKLLSIGQVAPVPLTPLQPPYPNWYKPDLTCEYHAGIAGHNIESCNAFQNKLLQLIKAGWITFDDAPNVNSNPLPNHTASSGGVNAVGVEDEMPIDATYMRPSTMTARAYDGSPRQVIGTIDIELFVGPQMFLVTLQVMDIHPSYSMLLGRPWIHASGAVTSSLHQCLKYIINGTLVKVKAEETLSMIRNVSVPYIEVEDCKDGNLHAFEIVNTEWVLENTVLRRPIISDTSRMIAKCFLKHGLPFQNASLTGSFKGVNMMKVKAADQRFGLGFKPKKDDYKRAARIKRERRLARMEGRKPEEEDIVIPPIHVSFPKSAYVMKPENMIEVLGQKLAVMDINNVEEGEGKGWNYNDEPKTTEEDELLPQLTVHSLEEAPTNTFVRKLSVDEVFQNWEIEEAPVVFKKNPENESSINPQTYCIENEWPNFDKDVIAMDEEEWNEDDMKEFTRRVEQSEHAWKSAKEELEVINVGTEQDKRELKIGTLITTEERCSLTALLQEYTDVFAWSYADMPGLDIDIVVHRVPLIEGCKPVKQKLRRTRPDILLKVKAEIEKQWDAGFLEVIKYPQWVSNIVVVPKKDDKIRVCVDFRDLNKASPKDDFPLPHIDVLVDNAAKSSTYSFMDGFSGYNQIKMAEEDKEKTTFVTPWGTFCYKVMPFRLKNAGATYQRAMVTLFHDMMHKEIEVYVDDMIAKSKNGEDHVQVLRKLFDRLRKYQLKLNPAKCSFGVKSGKLLGFVISNKGIEVDPDKVKAIQAMTIPKTEKEVRGFLGRLNYIARFISQLTTTCEPIFRLLRKKNPGTWDNDCQEAFDKIKQYLQNPPLLVPPVPGRPLILYLTVTEVAMGCVLGQQDESGRKEQAIYYLSKKFTDCESRYTMTEKLCCALVWSTKRLRQYMLYYTTWLISKMDPLKYIFEKPYLSSRIARWQVMLAEYDIVYKTRTSVKGSVIADHLADNAIKDYEHLKFDFLDEDVLIVEEDKEKNDWWIMYFDGAVNVSGNGAGAVIISPDKKQYPISIKLQFECTNNTAEYEACILGLEAALEMKIKKLDVYGDSMLIICQVKGEWQTKEEKLIPYQQYLSKLTEGFDEIDFTHMGRDKNQFADALATLASMAKTDYGIRVQPICIEIRNFPAHCCAIEGEVDGNPWFYDIKRFIQYQEYPLGVSKADMKTLRRLAMEFYLDGEILYKRSFNGALLRCLDEIEAKVALQEIHEGICATHASGHMMARQLQRSGYFWMTMEKDCIDYVRKCHKCQVYSDKINAPPAPLFNMTSPWPFAMWGIDVIGPINPKASNRHQFILVAIDYFTKWVEASSYAHVTQKVVKCFIEKDLICRYGSPEKIVTDNAQNFNGKIITELCVKWKIKHSNSSPYRPKMNGAVEAANKNIKKIIQKMVVTYKDWHEMLPFALHAYRTAVRTSTGATPYSLVFGMEAVMPLEVEIPSLRVLMESELEEAEWAKVRYEQLNMISEKRLAAICHHQLYQRRMAKAYDRKVRPREFKEGDLVLRKILPLPSEDRSKWAPNYEGPYVVKKAFSGGALLLTRMDGDDVSRPVNSDSVKKYYV